MLPCCRLDCLERPLRIDTVKSGGVKGVWPEGKSVPRQPQWRPWLTSQEVGELEWLSRLGHDGQAFVLLYPWMVGCESLKEGRERSTTPYKFTTIHCVQEKSLSCPSCYRRNTSRFLSMVLMMLEMWLHPHDKRNNRKTQIYWHFPTLLEQRHIGSVSVNLKLMRFFFFIVAIVCIDSQIFFWKKKNLELWSLTYWGDFCFFFFF